MFESSGLKAHEGKFYGFYRAKVLSNKDESFMGRIKVECPAVYGDGIESPWCFAAMPMAGSTFGVFVTPPNGSYVYITFEMGSSDYPVWVGSPYAVGSPDEMKKTKTGKPRSVPCAYGMRTPGGNVIVLDDDSENNEIRIISKTGSSVVLQKDGSILLKPASGKSVIVEGNLTAQTINTNKITSASAELTNASISSINATSCNLRR